MKKHTQKTHESYIEEYQINICFDKRDKIFIAKVPELENCQSHGESAEKALKNVREAMTLWLETAKKEKISIPKPLSRRKYSGKFVLRTSEELHEKLTQKACLNGQSMNELACRILEDSLRR